MAHNTPEKNEAFRRAWDATNARWKAQQTPIVSRETGAHSMTNRSTQHDKQTIIDNRA